MEKPHKVYLTSYDSQQSTDLQGNCHLSFAGTGIQGVKKIRLTQFSLTNTIYNVRTGINDQMCWYHSGSSYHFQIPAGQYNISALLTQIQIGMNATDANSYALTYNSSTFFVTITGTSAFSLNFASNSFSSTSCSLEIGFNQADTASSISISGTNAVDLSFPNLIFICIPEIQEQS